MHLLARGKRVGVSSTSHKAIHNLLREVEEVAAEAGVDFRGLKKSSGGADSVFTGRFDRASTGSNAGFADPEVQLVAGTAWLLCRPELDGTLDYLFVDEAGQVSLADALALGTAARTLVLLGDPVQLAQVTQAIHPAGSGVSVLEHLLGEHATIPEDRGLFLEHSFRMHPDVCRYISDAFYAGRLESAAPERPCAAGTGLRWLAVEHEGNRTSSVEEAAAIRAEIEARGLSPADVMVVAPYNMQVRLLARELPGVRVGTVDKFQGQQAPVVFFSMATSSGAYAPRGIDFLMSRNRLNVAVSRAQCLAYLVCAPGCWRCRRGRSSTCGSRTRSAASWSWRGKRRLLADLVVGALVPGERIALDLVRVERAGFEVELLVALRERYREAACDEAAELLDRLAVAAAAAS